MSIISKYNKFYINGSFIHQKKGAIMDTHVAVAYPNLTCGYLEVKLFNKLPKIAFYDIVEFKESL